MSLQVLTVTTTNNNAEAISDFLMMLGALSVTLEDAADQPIYEPGVSETPLWNAITLSAMFESDIKLEEIITFLNNQFPQAIQATNTQPLVEQDWSQLWLDHFKPMYFGKQKRLLVCAKSHAIDDPKAATLFLEPGLAFGTGTHPTTALCLSWLADHLKQKDIVVDYGCGSGILSIAALKLGASKVYAIDNDPQALQATLDNANNNNITPDQLIITTPEKFKPVQADCVVANILANTLIDLADVISAQVKPQGYLILSGVLIEQIDPVIQAYDKTFLFQPAQILEDWGLLIAQKN